jgi:cytochrome c biogenesis factor
MSAFIATITIALLLFLLFVLRKGFASLTALEGNPTEAAERRSDRITYTLFGVLLLIIAGTHLLVSTLFP